MLLSQKTALAIWVLIASVSKAETLSFSLSAINIREYASEYRAISPLSI